MSKNNNLKDFVTDIADTLRTLTKTTEPINPQDFTIKMHDIKENLDAELNEQDALLADLQSSVDELPNALDLSDASATSNDILEGKTAYVAEGKVTGTYKDMLQARVDSDNSCAYLFYSYSGESFDFAKKLDTSNATSMSYMFSKLKFKGGLDLSLVGWDTRNIESMEGLLNECTNLESINLSGWNTNNVNNMTHLCSKCSSATSINLSGWNTSNVTTLYGAFDACEKVKTLNLSGWDLSNVTNMRNAFSNGTLNNMVDADLSNLNVKSVTNAYYLFYMNRAVKTINISGWDTSHCTNFEYAFGYCDDVTDIIGEIDLFSATNVSAMFSNCVRLQNLTLKNIRKSLTIGSGTSYGKSLTDESIINTFKELWDLTGGTSQKLKLSTASNTRSGQIYVKLIDVTDEMRAEDQYIDNKKPCIVCESTDEGAMTLKEYGISKNWSIA